MARGGIIAARTTMSKNVLKSMLPPRAVNIPSTEPPISWRSSSGVASLPTVCRTSPSSVCEILPSPSRSKRLNACFILASSAVKERSIAAVLLNFDGPKVTHLLLQTL